MRAVVVSESSIARWTMRSALTGAKFQVVEAGGVREAAAVLSGIGPFDLALVDWSLPRAGGLRLVRSVRASREGASLRVIMVMPGRDVEAIVEASVAGVDECLQMPLTRKRVLAKLALLHFPTG
jgi:two-component system cell cycle response regulator